MVIVGIMVYQLFAHNLRQATAGDFEKEQKLFTNTATNEIERYFYDVQKRLETIALMPVVRNAQRGENCNQELQNLIVVNSKEFNNLGRISKDGTFICAVNRTIIGEPASKYGTYFDTIAKDPEHKAVMSRLIYPTGSTGPVMAVHVAVYDAQGNFDGTIGGAVYFDELQERVLQDVHLSKNNTIAIYDDNMDILYHPDPLIRSKNLLAPAILGLYSPREVITRFVEDTKKAPAGGVITYSLQGHPRQTAYKSAHVIGRYWTVGIAVPYSDIEQYVGRHTAKYICITLLALLAAAVTALAFFFLPRPMRHDRQSGGASRP